MAENSPFDPKTYRELMAHEVPSYAKLQAQTAAATAGAQVGRLLDLGAGTGETTQRVLTHHPGAEVVALDESTAMLDDARRRLPATARLLAGRLEEPLPEGPFDLVVSALAIHHLDGPGKADLFRRVAAVLRPGGRFVLGDLIVPEDPRDVVTPVDGVFDIPSPLGDQVRWLTEAGFATTVTWLHRDLAVVAADLPAPGEGTG